MRESEREKQRKHCSLDASIFLYAVIVAQQLIAWQQEMTTSGADMSYWHSWLAFQTTRSDIDLALIRWKCMWRCLCVGRISWCGALVSYGGWHLIGSLRCLRLSSWLVTKRQFLLTSSQLESLIYGFAVVMVILVCFPAVFVWGSVTVALYNPITLVLLA